MGQPDQPDSPDDLDRVTPSEGASSEGDEHGGDASEANSAPSGGGGEEQAEEVLLPWPSISKKPTPAKNSIYSGSEVLGDSSPTRILENLLDGDPLDIEGRGLMRMRFNAVLIDGDRLFDRATAWIALQAMKYDGTPALGEWLDRLIDSTLRDILDEDFEQERQGTPPWDVSPSHFLAETLGVEPPIAHKCAVIFNGLPIPVRRAFWVMVMQGKSLNRAVAEGHGPPELTEARVRYAMGMMATLGDWVEPNPDPGAPTWNWAEDEEGGAR